MLKFDVLPSCWLTLAVTAILVGNSGCRLCCAPNDWDYATTGGKHQRVDMVHGRLGSPFSDPNAGNMVNDVDEREYSGESYEAYDMDDYDGSDIIEIPGSDFEIR